MAELIQKEDVDRLTNTINLLTEAANSLADFADNLIGQLTTMQAEEKVEMISKIRKAQTSLPKWGERE